MISSKKLFDDDELRREIASIIARDIKSYNVPRFCVHLGIQDHLCEDDDHEAHRSKRLYVISRLQDLNTVRLLEVARQLKEQHTSNTLDDILSAIRYSDKPVTALVRRDVLKTLNELDSLFGERDLFEVLEAVFGLVFNSLYEITSPRGFTRREYIEQHYLRNPEDMSTEVMLIECGALDCSQARFFHLIAEILHPASRRDHTQSELASAISAPLARSGYRVATTGADSGYPIYEVVGLRSQVSGAMKNIIFASTGPKPELVFRDAINNDVEITRNSEHVLVYDLPMPANGAIEWKHLRDWWAKNHNVNEALAKSQLFQRLQQSVRSGRSAGEYAIFRTFYKIYAPLLGDKLPALLPQVYLHYDLYTKRQRGEEQVLTRQRMDFLLMLEHGVRIVIEVDGRHHYATDDGQDLWIANAQKYAEMASEDRRLRLAGYEVYRFGGAEFSDVELKNWSVGADAEAMLKRFFDQLLKSKGLLPV